MSGPWDKYAQPDAAPSAAPWEKYAATAGGMQDWEPRQFTTGEKVSRAVGQFATAANDALYGAAMAPADISGWIARKTGLVSPDAKPPSRAVTDTLASVPSAVGLASPDAQPRFEPAGALEKGARGAGDAVGNALAVMAPASVLANTARGVTQGVANVLRSQPILQTTAAAAGGAVGGATDNPWLGLGTSLAVPVGASIARRVITPVTNALTPQEQRLATAAAREDIPLTAAQRTGSPGLKAVEATMAKIPGSSGPMQEMRQTQREAFNSAALRRAGVTATDASPETIERAFANAGQTFDDLATRTTLNVDRQFSNDVTRVAQEYGRRLPTDVAPVFQSYIDDLQPVLQAAQGGQNPQIAGEIYARIRSGIGARIRAASGRPDLQEALGGLQTALDDAVERSTSGALRQEWQTARREYQALMTIDRAMQGGTQADRSMGNVPFSGLKQAVRQADPRGFSRGRGQLNEVSRIGEFIADKVPDSGTPTRSAIANPLMWPVMAAGNLGARAYTSGPIQNYLSNQLMGRTNYGAQYGGAAARQAVEEATEGRNALRRRDAR